MIHSVRDIVVDQIYAVAGECGLEMTPSIVDETKLLESGLDSLGFAILVVRLEEELGYDPFTLAPDAFYPETLGAFVSFYDQHRPS